MHLTTPNLEALLGSVFYSLDFLGSYGQRCLSVPRIYLGGSSLIRRLSPRLKSITRECLFIEVSNPQFAIITRELRTKAFRHPQFIPFTRERLL